MHHGNLPAEGQVFLDHVGHFAADADAAATALAKAGFTVTPFSAQHAPDPKTGELALTGTGNVCVMLRSGYLEFLTYTADTAIGREFRETLARRAGVHLAAFSVPDAESFHAGLSAAGMPMRPIVRFSREVESPDGPMTARFTVSRLERGTMAEGRVQALTHWTESAVWQTRWLDHPNGVTGLSALLVSAPDPGEAAARFSAFLGRPSAPMGAGRRIALERGAVEFLPEAEATRLVGHAVEPGTPAMIGYRLQAKSIETTRSFLEMAALAPRMEAGALVVPLPPALGEGVWLFGEAN